MMARADRRAGSAPPVPELASSSGWKVLLGLARAQRLRIAVLAVASFASASLEAGFLILITMTVVALAAQEEVLGPVLGVTVPIGGALGIAAVALILRLVLSLMAVRMSTVLTARVRNHLRARAARAYLASSWAVQQGEVAGRLQELLSSFVWRVTNAVSALTNGITAVLSLVAFLATGLGVDFTATAAVLAVLALLAGVLTPVRRRIRRLAVDSSAHDLEFAGAVAELGALGQEMQTFGVRTQFVERLDALSEQATESQRQVQRLQGAMAPLYTTFAYAAVLLGLSGLALLGVSDLSTAGAVTLLMLRSLSYGQQLLAVSGTIASALPFVERLDQAVSSYEAQPASGGDRIPAAVTPLELSDVGFSYDDSQTALSGVTATIQPGEVIGVIGPSGAGKSTLAQLVLGLHPPTHGVIHVSGVDLRTVDRDWWARKVAFVPQDALLVTGTVAENIRFFRDGVDEAAVRKAIVLANLAADVEALPLGVDTHLGERGNQLSGGQRQRISIARALAGGPALLILDEPTSALDGQSESLIRDTVAGLRGHITVMIIAHRMSTLDMCDRIMVIEDGRIAGLGTPDDVRTQSSFYRRAMSLAGLT